MDQRPRCSVVYERAGGTCGGRAGVQVVAEVADKGDRHGRGTP